MMLGRGEKLGEIREGYLADLLVVDGDPLADLSVLRNPKCLVVIMKNGDLYKNSTSVIQQRAVA
jgi:imidazolonepropionase-like amidohydrolase